MPRRTTKAPPITRVHKLFRLRTVVNDISLYDTPTSKGVITKDVGQILVDRKLSKVSIIESANKLKRARDHALNTSILGLTIPIPKGNSFIYKKSPVGELLSVYSFENECPFDLRESSIFADRMMKLKLTNAYDSRNTYSKFHSRPFLNILTILKHRPLHISHIHYVISLFDDFSLYPDTIAELLDIFSSYRSYDEEESERFIEDFQLSDEKTRREIGRSTKPLLDWAKQGNLLTVDKKGWCLITENGKAVQEFYINFYPIWYDQLGFNAPLQSAILLISQLGYQRDFRLNRSKLPAEYLDVLQDLSTRFEVWNKFLTKLNRPIDFSLDYDIPYNQRAEVEAHIEKISELLDLTHFDPYTLSLNSIYQLEDTLVQTKTETDFVQLNDALGIKIPRRECFQTDLEWKTCIRLRLLGLPAIPYQGEYEGATDLPMANDNPDVVIRNAIRSLVEVKSSSEWGQSVKLGKRIGGELMMYQSYAEDINANSVLFVCDVDEFHPTDFIASFCKRGDKLNKIILTNWAFLREVIKDRDQLDGLITVLTTPEDVDPLERIFEYTQVQERGDISPFLFD